MTKTKTSITPEKTSFKTIAVSGGESQDPIVADSKSDTLTLAAGSDITLTTNATTDTVTIAYSGEGGGGGGDTFKTIAVSGQSSVVADSAIDTLTLVGGTNVTIKTDASADSITINSADVKSDGGVVIESDKLAVDLGASSITGTLAIGDGGTGATGAPGARTALDVDKAGTDNSTNVTLANTNYLSLSGQELTGGTIPLTSGGTGATGAAGARTALDVDKAGTDNSTNVTLANTNYLSLSDQELTGGTIPLTSGGTGATSASAARTALGIVLAAAETSFGTSATGTVTLGKNNQTLNLVASTLNIDSTSALKLNSSGGDITIGGDGDDHNINIGTDGVRIITIGNTEEDTRVHIQTTSKHGIHLDGGNTYDGYNKIIMHNLPGKGDLDGSEPNGMLYHDEGIVYVLDEGGDDY